MPALGTYALGSEGLGGTVVHDLPTVAISAPTGTLTTGGPTVSVAWDYAQAQSDVQGQFRVEFLNDALSTSYYDSGWRFGTDTSFDVDLAAEGVPMDSSDVTVRVTVRSEEGDVWQSTADTEAIALEWGVVSCTIDYPPDGAVIGTSTLTVQWTFGSTRSKTQDAFRVRLLTEFGSELFDSGWVDGNDSSYVLPYVFSDGSSYRVGVQLRNSEGALS